MSLLGRWRRRRQARKQIRWGLEYIRERYGPANAYDWYDRGGSLPRGLPLARNDTDRPERCG